MATMESILRRSFQCFIALAALLPVASLRADLLTFDDLPAQQTEVVVPNGYWGLDWDHLWAINAQQSAPTSPPSFLIGMLSAPNVAITRGYTDFYSPTETPFDLGSAWFTAGFSIGQSVTVDGYVGGLGGTLEDTVTFTINDTSPTLKDFNWGNIDAVSITTTGGTVSSPNGLPGYLIIDNIDFPKWAPEPATWLMAIPALVWLAVRRRRQLSRV